MTRSIGSAALAIYTLAASVGAIWFWHTLMHDFQALGWVPPNAVIMAMVFSGLFAASGAIGCGIWFGIEGWRSPKYLLPSLAVGVFATVLSMWCLMYAAQGV